MVHIQVLMNSSCAREHRTFVPLIICPVERFQCLDEYRITSTFEQLTKFTRGWHVIRRTRWIIWYQRKNANIFIDAVYPSLIQPLRTTTEQRLNNIQIHESLKRKYNISTEPHSLLRDFYPISIEHEVRFVYSVCIYVHQKSRFHYIGCDASSSGNVGGGNSNYN